MEYDSHLNKGIGREPEPEEISDIQIEININNDIGYNINQEQDYDIQVKKRNGFEEIIEEPTKGFQNLDEKLQDDKIDFYQALKQARGQNRYFELYCSIFMIWNYCTGDYLVYNLAYLELQPVFECLSSETGDYAQCTAKDYCREDTVSRINYDHETSLKNWQTDLNLACESSSTIAMLGSAYFIGYSLACLIMPRLADIYGRKIFYLSSSALQLFLYLGIMLSRSAELTTALIVFFGICGVGRSAIGYLYLLEMIPAEWKNIVGTLTHVANSFTFIISAVYFWKLSKDWEWFILFALISNAITVVAVSRIPESPKFTYSTKSGEYFNQNFTSEKVIKPVDRLNQDIGGETISQTYSIEQQENYEKKSKEGSLINLVKNKKMLRNLIIMTTLLVASQFNYFLICFNIKYMPGVIFMNQIIAASCEIAFLFISSPFIKFLGLRRSLVIGFSMSLIGSVPLMFEIQNQNAATVMILLARVGMIFMMNVTYLAFSTLFPPIFAQTTFGFAKLIARIITILAPLIAELEAPSPMIVFTIFSILGAIFSMFIIQTNQYEEQGVGVNQSMNANISQAIQQQEVNNGHKIEQINNFDNPHAFKHNIEDDIGFHEQIDVHKQINYDSSSNGSARVLEDYQQDNYSNFQNEISGGI
eukprot:403377046